MGSPGDHLAHYHLSAGGNRVAVGQPQVTRLTVAALDLHRGLAFGHQAAKPG